MDSTTTDITVGMLMGLAYIAAPGPVNVETLRQGLSRGWRTALPIQLGACIGHVTWATLAFVGLGVLVLHPAIHIVLGGAGTALLLYLGWSSLQQGVRSLHAHGQKSTVCGTLPGGTPVGTRRTLRSFAAGVTISLTNPFAVAFWLSVGGTVLHQSGRSPELFLSGFFLSVLAWAMALPTAIAVAHGMLQGRGQAWVSSTCGLVLIGFGCMLGRALLPA